MKLQNRHLKIRPYLLYGFAALVLLVFLGKNTAAYEAHLTDVRNSAGPPLPVGAEVPEFSMEDSDGAILESSQLPETSTLVLAIVGCPYAQAVLSDLNAKEGVENVYAVYIGVGSKEDQEKFEEFTRNYENLHIMLDHKNSVKWSFRTDSYPTTFTLKGGKIVQKEVGYLGGVTAVEDGGEKDEMRNP